MRSGVCWGFTAVYKCFLLSHVFSALLRSDVLNLEKYNGQCIFIHQGLSILSSCGDFLFCFISLFKGCGHL